eukprot:scpid56164/ scgid24070/ 
MELQTLFTLVCIILGLAIILYGALGWIVSQILRRCLNLDIDIEGLGLRSANRITCNLSKTSIAVSNFSVGLGQSLPWAPRSRLFSVVIGHVGVTLKPSAGEAHTATASASTSSSASASPSPASTGPRADVANTSSSHRQDPDQQTQQQAGSASQPVTGQTASSPSSQSTQMKKKTKPPSQQLLVRFLVFLCRHIDVIVREVEVEVQSADSSGTMPATLSISMLSGLKLDLSSANKKRLLVQLKIHDVSTDLSVGAVKRSVADAHLALTGAVEVDLNKGFLPVSSAKLSLQSPAITLHDKALEALKSLTPRKPQTPTVSPAQSSSPSSSAVLPAKLAKVGDVLGRLLPELIEVRLEEISARCILQNGQRECDLELSKALVCLQRASSSQCVSLQLPAARPVRAAADDDSSVTSCTVPACDASLMLTGLNVRCGQRPPILSLQRTRLTAKISTDESPSTASSTNSSSSSSGVSSTTGTNGTDSSAVRANDQPSCRLSTSLSLDSIQLIYWHAEIKQWLALIPSTQALSHDGQTMTSSPSPPPPPSSSSQPGIMSLVKHMPVNMKLKTCVSVNDVSLGVVADKQLNVATVNKPRCRVVLATATVQTELEEELSSTAAGSAESHRSLQWSCRLENAYVHNCQSPTRETSAHFHPDNLLCPVVTAGGASTAAASSTASASSSTDDVAPRSPQAASETPQSSQQSSETVLWLGEDDPSVLPTSNCHLYGRPLELGGLSCKVSATLPLGMRSTRMTSSHISHDVMHEDRTSPVTTTASCSTEQRCDTTAAAGHRQPVDVAVDLSRLCVEVSRPLLSSVSDALDELTPLLKRAIARRQAPSSSSTESPKNSSSPLFSLNDVNANVQLKHITALALLNQPGAVMGLAHVGSLHLSHMPTVASRQRQVASQSATTSSTSTAGDSPASAATTAVGARSEEAAIIAVSDGKGATVHGTPRATADLTQVPSAGGVDSTEHTPLHVPGVATQGSMAAQTAQTAYVAGDEPLPASQPAAQSSLPQLSSSFIADLKTGITVNVKCFALATMTASCEKVVNVDTLTDSLVHIPATPSTSTGTTAGTSSPTLSTKSADGGADTTGHATATPAAAAAAASRLAQGLLLINQLIVNKNAKVIRANIPAVCLDWSPTQHKTFTVLAEQLATDVIHVAGKLPTRAAAPTTPQAATTNTTTTTTTPPPTPPTP